MSLRRNVHKIASTELALLLLVLLLTNNCAVAVAVAVASPGSGGRDGDLVLPARSRFSDEMVFADGLTDEEEKEEVGTGGCCGCGRGCHVVAAGLPALLLLLWPLN
jgi:hypothetical protein